MNYLTEKQANNYVKQAKDAIEERWQNTFCTQQMQMISNIEDICNYCVSLVFEKLVEAIKLKKHLKDLEELEIEAVSMPHLIENREMSQDIEDLLEKVGIDALAVLDEKGNYFLSIDLKNTKFISF